MRTAVLGLGNELQGDDAAGLYTLRCLRQEVGDKPEILWLEVGVAPENFTGHIRAFEPDHTLLLDAADMGLPPGEYQWVDWQKIDGLSASTHTMPISLFIKFLKKDLDTEFHILGIQPQQLEFGDDLSSPVKTGIEEAVRELVALIQKWTGI